MRYENGIIDRNIMVADQVTLNGIINGNITVISGGDLTLIGICAGNLIVESGAHANIIGIVAGIIINNGGKVVSFAETTSSVTGNYYSSSVNDTTSMASSDAYSGTDDTCNPTYGKWTVSQKPESIRRRARRPKASNGNLTSFVATSGVSAADVANAKGKLKSCEDDWLNSGSPSVTIQEVERAQQEASRSKLQLASLSDSRHFGEFVEMAYLLIWRLFWRWPTVTAIMHTICLFAAPVLVFVVGWTNVVSLLGWYFAAIVVGYIILGYLLFFPFRDKLEARLAELENIQMTRKQEFVALRKVVDLTQAAFSEINRLHKIRKSCEHSRTEYARLVNEFKSQRNELRNSDWRAMRGVEFELFLARVFNELGYEVQTTNTTGDHGVDLIAIKGDARIAIQAKGYGEKKAANDSVQQVFSGQAHYKCTSCVVITNSTFTGSAYVIAKSNKCRLIDGAHIGLLIMGKIYS